MGDIRVGDTFFRLGRLKSQKFFPPTTKPFVWNFLSMFKNAGRVRILPMFLQVCLLELRDCVLCVISIPRGGFLEIFLNLLSRLIFRFLPDRPIIRTQIRMCKHWHVPLSRLSLTLSHAALVVLDSARGSNEASTMFAS